jgi:hypothetical protein
LPPSGEAGGTAEAGGTTEAGTTTEVGTPREGFVATSGDNVRKGRYFVTNIS